MGAPTKLTPERFYLICEAVKNGATPHRASREASVSKSSVSAWLRRGQEARARLESAGPDAEPTEDEAPYLALLEGVENAAREFEQQGLEAIREAGDGETFEEETVTERTLADGTTERTIVVKRSRKKAWTAWAWLLERTMPDRYARVSKIEGTEGPPVTVSVEERAKSLAQQAEEYLQSQHEGDAAEALAELHADG